MQEYRKFKETRRGKKIHELQTDIIHTPHVNTCDLEMKISSELDEEPVTLLEWRRGHSKLLYYSTLFLYSRDSYI